MPITTNRILDADKLVIDNEIPPLEKFNNDKEEDPNIDMSKWITGLKLYVLALFLLFLNSQIDWSEASLLDFIWPSRKVNFFSSDVQNLPSVPYEIADDSERFILDASKVLGSKLSELDFCQQRVIVQLKNSCKSLNDEQIGKLAVALMNCQSHTEGRDIFECSDSMSLRDCTSAMSPESWGIYNQFLGRAKAVCMSIRQDHFKAITEISVNKLMEATGHHLQMMEELKKSQKQLEQATLGSIDEMSENNLKLLEKQQELLRIAEAQRLGTEHNLREIMRERNLIKSGQSDVSAFITNLKKKIDVGLSEIENHSINIKDVYENLISDLTNLQDAAQRISNQLDVASELIINQNNKASTQIVQTVIQIKEANDIVQSMSRTLIDLRKDFDQRWVVVSKFFGGNENFLKIFPVVCLHLLYLLIGMMCLVFINADLLCRAIFLSTLLLNMAAVLYGFIEMNLALLTEMIVAVLLANIIVKFLRKVEWRKFLSVEDASTKNSTNLHNGYMSRINKTSQRNSAIVDNSDGYISRLNHLRSEAVFTDNNAVKKTYSESSLRSRCVISSDGRSPTPRAQPQKNEEEEDCNSERSATPFTPASVPGNKCKALTVRGLPCQLTTASSRTDFCRIHERLSIER